MKILMVTMSMGIGGAETHILELAKGLLARKIEVHIASAGGVFVQELTAAGIPHETLPLDRRELWAMLKAKKGLEALIRREGYDIVHAHARIPAFLCEKLHEKMRFRFVTTDHLDFELTPLLKKLTAWGEYTFVVSDDLKRYLFDNFHVNPDHISNTVNGIDTDYFSPEFEAPALRKSFHVEDRAVILHISRLDEPVTVCAAALMDAMMLLRGKAQLVIVGDGNHAEVLREKGKCINEKLGYPAVYFAGAQTDVRAYIAASDIVVSPSRAAMEGMACGKPTIISGSQGHGGIFSEKIEVGARKSNFCFRGSPLPKAEVLASEMDEILAMDTERRKELGLACRAFIEKYYSVDIMVESQLAVYEKLAPYRTGGAPDVLLCGYYGYGNLGDETLLSVIVRELRARMPSVRICVLSANPKETAMYHMVDAIDRFDLAAIGRKMKETKLFLFGGGSLLQDKTSVRSLSYYVHMLRMAKKNGAKIMLFANGIGPVFRQKSKRLVRDALSLADSISLRDLASYTLCTARQSAIKPRLTFDPAILAQGREEGYPDGDYFVVIPKKTMPDGAELLIKWTRYVMKTYEAKPIFVSLFDGQDKEYAEKLAAAVGMECISPLDAASCITLLSHAKLVLSARLHGLVYATAAAVPMIAFSDDVKLFSYMETIGLGTEDAYPLAYHIGDTEDILMQRTDMLLLKESHIRAHLNQKLPLWRASADAEFDEILRFLNDTPNILRKSN